MKLFSTNRKFIVFILGFIAGYSSLLSIIPQSKKVTYGNAFTDNSQLKNDMKKVGQDIYKAML